MDFRRVLDVEQALRWAYRDELPKAPRLAKAIRDAAPDLQSGWGMVDTYTKWLAAVDLNQYGVLPDMTASSLPHDDAYRIAEAVQALDAYALVMPDDWAPLSDLGDLGAEGAACIAKAMAREMIIDSDGWRRMKTGAARLIVRHAIMGGCPEWEADACERRPIRENGQPKWFRRQRVLVSDISGDPAVGHWHETEVDGMDRKRRRPHADAYRKYVLEPDPGLAIVGRAHYEIWQSALELLVEDLAGLETIRVVASGRLARPWEGGGRVGVVLPDLSRRPERGWLAGVRQAPRREKMQTLGHTATVA